MERGLTVKERWEVEDIVGLPADKWGDNMARVMDAVAFVIDKRDDPSLDFDTWASNTMSSDSWEKAREAIVTDPTKASASVS